VNHSAALRLVLIMLLLPTLGWKVAADRKPTFTSKDLIVNFLKHHKFEVNVTKQMILTDLPLIIATTGGCRMLVAEAAPDGWNREAIRELAGTIDKLFIVERGKVRRQQSAWQTVTHAWWSRYFHKLRMDGHEMPLIAVAATASCNAEQLPWAELNNPAVLEKARL
jgi:hypothetical protein